MSNFINTSVNKSCESLYDGKQYLTVTHKYILVSFNTVVMLLNIVANSTVIHVLLKKKLLGNLSMRLILYLGISDCCVALIAQPVYNVMLIEYSSTVDCTFDTIAQFITILLMHVSGYIIILIGYDRYCRMKYLNRYSEVIKLWKINAAMAIIILLSLMQGLLGAFGTHTDVFEKVNLIVVSIDMVIILLIFLIYIMTIMVVRKHKSTTINKDILRNIDRSVTSMSARILVALVVLYTPYLATTVMHHSLIDKSQGKKRQDLNFALFAGYELICVNSFANAVIFLTLHKQYRFKEFASFKLLVGRRNILRNAILRTGRKREERPCSTSIRLHAEGSTKVQFCCE